MDKNKEKRIFMYVISTIALTISFVFICFKWQDFLSLSQTVLSSASPLFAGLVVAFVLNAVMKLFENIIFKPINKHFDNTKVWQNMKRPLCVLFSYITLAIVIVLVFLFIIPELYLSIENFFTTASKTLPIYAKELSDFAIKTINDYNLEIDYYAIQSFVVENFNITSILDNTSKAATDIFNSIISATFSLASVIFSLVMSLIFSVYFLLGKENLILTFKKILYSYAPRKHANRISMLLSVSNKIFSNYVRGQLTECVILGTLCFIGMSIIGLDYALMISTIITVSALVPIVGAFVGAGAGAILLLLVNPIDAIWFLIFFIILQQFEGNVIYPKVVGSSIGLPAIWTLASVSIMGGLFGIIGVLIGPPTAAVIYTLLRHNSKVRLQKKQITTDILMGSEVEKIYSDILDIEHEEIFQTNKKKLGKGLNFSKQKIRNKK